VTRVHEGACAINSRLVHSMLQPGQAIVDGAFFKGANNLQRSAAEKAEFRARYDGVVNSA
jgi:hypothetical protein